MRAQVALAALTILTACTGSPRASSSWTTSRDTLASGIVRVTNTPPASGSESPAVIQEDLRIGTREGSGPDAFGQIKGLAVLRDGRIAVLDALAKEVRLFDRTGAYLTSYGGAGQGPGELEGPLGLMRDHEGRLWIPDSRNGRMSVFDPNSGYLRSFPMKIYSYRFIWSGVMLDDDRIAKPSETLVPDRRPMLRIYGPDMMQVDSFPAPAPSRPLANPENAPGTFYWKGSGGSYGLIGVPFYPHGQSVLDPSGGEWSTPKGDPDYRIARENFSGDTILVIRTRRPPVPVSEASRKAAIQSVRKLLRRIGVNANRDWSRIPKVKPAVQQLFVSGDGQLWVRIASSGARTCFDVYDRDGAFRRSVETSIELAPYLEPIVRGDTLWGVEMDSLGVQYVVRGSIRDVGGRKGGTRG